MKVSDIKRVACLGGGVIGSSWAINFAMYGLDVILRDINDEMVAKSEDQIIRYLDSLLAADALTPARRQYILQHITLTTSLEEAVRDAQFIQENGPERLPIKQSILAEVDQYAPADAIYASSTSGLLISDIARGSAHPERCLGGHPYNPPHLIPLVELTQGEGSNPSVVRTAYDFYQSVGKEAVLLNKECPGFIANRLQMAVFREMTDLVQRGVCSVEDVDKALVFGPGIRWGVYGQHMVMQMGNPNGLKGMMEMLGNVPNTWLADMADWKTMPEDWTSAQEGVDLEMAHFPDFKGHDNVSCAAFRDRALIEILKIHKKL